MKFEPLSTHGSLGSSCEILHKLSGSRIQEKEEITISESHILSVLHTQVTSELLKELERLLSANVQDAL